MQDVYSWCGTNVHLPMTEEVAAAYNRASDAIAKIPADFDFTKPIYVEAERSDMDVWNQVGGIINALIELNGGTLNYTEDDMPHQHFVKV